MLNEAKFSPLHIPIPKKFYLSEDVVSLGQELLGKILYTQDLEGNVTGGIISETESYMGPFDKASHAYNGRRTVRNEMMYQSGGIAYVYLCYGIHNLFNVVTHVKDSPHAVLIRSLIPVYGLAHMIKRRKGKMPISCGPGLVCQSMQITLHDNGQSLLKNRIWIEDRGFKFPNHDILCGPRIGIDYAEEHASLPWRFYLSKNLSNALIEP